MAWPPAVAKLVVSVAVPPAPTAKVPRTTLPSLNVTVPVGAPVPAGPRAATAKDTAGPTTTGVATATGAEVVAWGEGAFSGAGGPAEGLPGRLSWPLEA